MTKWTRRLFLSLLLIGLVFCLPRSGFAAEKQQTVPTRTATPPPSPTPDDQGGGGDPTSQPPPTNQPPPATNTPFPDTPEPTTTDAPAVTLVATPEGGFWPTAAPCSPLPTIQALGRVNVRNGPGVEYTLLSQLSYLEVRPITGRAQFAAWWQIELADGSRGWVSDQFVRVSGYTGQVPIVTAPALTGGSTPVPGPQWDPTPNPVCTPFPTNSATQTPNSTATTASTTAGGNPVAPTASSGRGDTGVVPLSEAPAEAETDTQAEPTPAAPPPAIPVVPTAVDEQIFIVAEATQMANKVMPEPAQRLPLGWLPIAGLGLMAAGTVVLIFRRQ